MDLLLFRHKKTGVLEAEIKEEEKSSYQLCVIFDAIFIHDNLIPSYSSNYFFPILSSSFIDIVEII